MERRLKGNGEKWIGQTYGAKAPVSTLPIIGHSSGVESRVAEKQRADGWRSVTEEFCCLRSSGPVLRVRAEFQC